MMIWQVDLNIYLGDFMQNLSNSYGFYFEYTYACNLAQRSTNRKSLCMGL